MRTSSCWRAAITSCRFRCSCSCRLLTRQEFCVRFLERIFVEYVRGFRGGVICAVFLDPRDLLCFGRGHLGFLGGERFGRLVVGHEAAWR